MKRVRAILLYLAVGAVVNMLVAWGCAIWMPINHFKLGAYPAAPRLWNRLGLSEPCTPIALNHGLGVRTATFYWHDRRMVRAPCQHDAGWPFASLWGYHDAAMSPSPALGVFAAPRWMYSGADDLHWTRMIPTKPLWIGLVANSLCYSLALLVLTSSPLAMRRESRIRRGLCPRCTYDLGGTDHASCPECGAAIPGAKTP